MNKEDYSKYYIQGSDHYLIPKDIFDELFNEMENWKKEAHQYKEVIDKATKYINGAYEMAIYTKSVSLEEENIEDLLDILKEVEHEQNI